MSAPDSPPSSSLPSPVPPELAPRGPWSFLGAACAGGFTRWGLHLMLAWLVFALATDGLWVLHLGRLIGWSSLPSYWGETLTGRDVWELLENGGLRAQPTGPWVLLAGAAALAWVLWAGWRHQGEIAGRPARFGPWAWGFLDALAVGLAPLAVVAGLALWALAGLEGTGVPALGWVHWVGASLVRLTFVSALFLHWWLFRLARAGGPVRGRFGAHLAQGFARFWGYGGQWLALVLAGAAVRSGLALAVLAVAWRLGGGTVPRVAAFLGLEVLAVLVNAWLLGWFLRLTALFLRHDDAIPAPEPPAPADPDPAP